MPSSTSKQSRNLSKPYLNNIRQVLQAANERCSQIAASVRASLHPTYHARKRAHALELRVSVEKALKLDQKFVSKIPLPLLERTVTPPDASAVRRANTIVIPPMRVVAPVPIHPQVKAVPQVYPQHAQIVLGSPVELSAKVVGREREIRRLSCQSTELPAPNMDMLKFDVTVTVSELESQGHSYWSSSDESGSEDESGVSVCSGARPSLHLDVPVEATHHLSWSSDCSSSGSASESSTNSSPIHTPEITGDLPKLMIRIKRKPSTASFMDTEDEIVSSEKRPKYERKEWIQTSARKAIQRPSSSRSFPSASSRR